jgi:hypothetical protein
LGLFRHRTSDLHDPVQCPRVVEFGADKNGGDFVGHGGNGTVHAQPVVFGPVSVPQHERLVHTDRSVPVGDAPRPTWPVSVVISTSTNGRALQSNSRRATTDATLISKLPLRDYALGSRRRAGVPIMTASRIHYLV